MKRLLFIAHRVPYPPDKGERVRAFNEIKALSQHFQVTVGALAHGEKDYQSARALRQWCQDVLVGPAGGKIGLLRGAWSLLRGRSVTEGFFHSRCLMREIVRESRREPFDVAVGYSSSTLPYLLAAGARARVMDLVDADSAKWTAYAAAAGWPKRWLYRREAGGVDALERRAAEQCDALLLVSQAEVDALSVRSERLIPIGNGVDTEYFQPRPRSGGSPSLVFTGTMDYRPNIEGVCWFVREVWPTLKQIVPDLTFSIVGRNPTPAVRALARTLGVNVTGSVPDVRPYLAEASIAVVPLHIARGIQNKALEAMAMGRAVVASPQALEGLEVQVGQEVLAADTPEEWRTTILRLLGTDTLRAALGRRARERVEKHYTWAARLEPLVRLCLALACGQALPVPGLPADKPGPAEALPTEACST